MNTSFIILLIAVPLGAAFLSVLVKKLGKYFLGAAIGFNLAASGILAYDYVSPVIYEIGGFKPPYGISLVLDEYSLLGILLLNVVFALIAIMACKYIKKYEVVLSVALAALNGVILTGDLFNLFVFMEISAIAAYILTTMNKNIKYTFNYLVLGTLGSGLLLFGIAVIYNMFGSLNIMDIQNRMAIISYPVAGALVLPLALIFTGLSVEAKLLPFSGWARGVLKDSNSLVGTLIVSAFSAAVLLAFGRLIDSLFVMSDSLLIVFTVVTVGTLILAEIAAFSKKNLREILLFSSIAQSGLVVALFLQGLKSAALLVLINNVISKMILFTLAAKIGEDNGTDKLEDLKGVFLKNKVLGFGFTAAAMSLIGLPLFFGFIAKANVLVSLFEANNIWLPMVILIVSVIEGAYVVRMLTTLWNTGEEGELAKAEDAKQYKLTNKVRLTIIITIAAIAIVAAGILPLLQMNDWFNFDILSFLTDGLGGV
ncbi:MAG: NADH-ubiquinone oxidoreductase [Clostridia bacterium]|nr:NADH-ubiquinone oxidoreductase [Clostridia bacterium]